MTTTTAPRTFVIVRREAMRIAFTTSPLSVREIADTDDVLTRSTVGHVIAAANGSREPRPVRLEIAEAIAKALNAPVGDLFAHANGDPLSGI